jgi:hypothetical protein
MSKANTEDSYLTTRRASVIGAVLGMAVAVLIAAVAHFNGW